MNFLHRLLFFSAPGGDLRVEGLPRFANIQGPGQAVLFLLFAALLLGLAWWLYRREPDYLSPRKRRLLRGLRLGAAACALFSASGIYLEMIREEPRQGTLVLLFDESESMGIQDRRITPEQLLEAQGMLGLSGDLGAEDVAALRETSRHAFVRRMIHKPGGFLSAVAGRYDLVAYSFGEASQASALEIGTDASGHPLVALGAPDQKATRMGSALRDAANRLRGRYLEGIVLFTDGGSNQGEDPGRVARDLHVPLMTVGVGLPDAKDIEVRFVLIEDVLFKGDEFPVHVRLRQSGYAGRSGRLILRRGDEVIHEEAVPFTAEPEMTVVARIPAREAGVFSFSAEIEPFEDEITAANNLRVRPNVRIIDSKIQVLVVEDAPRWEFRYLWSVLQADKKRIEARALLRQVDPRRISERGSRYVAAFPRGADELRKLNLLVLGDVAPDLLTRADMDNIVRWVREEGGAVVFVAGHGHMPGAYADTPLAELIPVDFARRPPMTREEELSAPPNPGFQARITRDGLRSPMFRLAPDPAANALAWEKASTLFTHLPSLSLKPGATVLMEHPSVTLPDGAPMPLILGQRVGRGHVQYHASFDTWRWRSVPGGEAHQRFWSQTVNSLTLPNLLGLSNQVRLESERTELTVGEDSTITAWVLDENLQPIGLPEIHIVVERSDLVRDRFRLAKYGERPGMYQGPARVLAEGAARVFVEGMEDKGDLLLSALLPRLEFESPAMRREELEDLARASQGHFVPLPDLDELAARLAGRAHGVRLHREERPLWNAPGLLLLLALLLGAEWFVRRKADLL